MSGNIRVRFAPSPTGYLHVGGLRTALFNYLFARANGGKIILRIEDTDRSRYVEGALENLLNVFNWLGIDFDEGPHIGGDCGPYIQSERISIYREHIEKLISESKAYRCFCTPERLEEMRRQQQSEGKTPMYDRKCREIPSVESAKRAGTEPFVVRMKMPLEGVIHIYDGVRGRVDFDAAMVDDQVLMKSDGYPTYHLANVVDDHLMGITDVIRGEEWLVSTPKHIKLYEFFNWELPHFHHLPLILNPDRSKLSKRQGDVAVEDYRARGYLPEALINYIVLLGWHPAEDREFFTLPELIEKFTLDRVAKSGAVFDLEKLNWLNREHMKRLSEDEFIEQAQEFIPAGFDFSGEKGSKILAAVRERIDKLADLSKELEAFSGRRKLPVAGEYYDIITSDDFKRLAEEILAQMDEIQELDGDSFKALMKTAGKAADVKGKNLWMPVRIALTGSEHGPDLSLIVEALGRDKFIALLKEAAEV